MKTLRELVAQSEREMGYSEEDIKMAADSADSTTPNTYVDEPIIPDGRAREFIEAHQAYCRNPTLATKLKFIEAVNQIMLLGRENMIPLSQTEEAMALFDAVQQWFDAKAALHDDTLAHMRAVDAARAALLKAAANYSIAYGTAG